MGSYDALYPDQDGGRLAAPAYCDPQPNLAPATAWDKRPVWPSKMFTIKLELEDFQRAHPGVPVYDASQGDGGLSLGGIPPAELAEALVRYLPEDRSTKYGNPVGREDVRRAIFDNYYRLGGVSGLDPDHVVLGDGGRDILQKWYQVVAQLTGGVGGNVVVSAAPWGSYTQGPYISSLNILRAPGSADNGFRITPDGVDAALEQSRADGRPVVGLIVTSPDNPTGNYTPLDELVTLVEHAVARGVPFVLLDLIYQAVTDPDVGLYDVAGLWRRLSPEARSRVAIMDGLTKSAGASNVRSAHLLTGSADFAKRVKGVATHTVLPNAVGEAAALEVYGSSEPLEHPWIRRVVGPTAESRALVRRRLGELGYRFIADQGYYAFVNIWPWLGKRLPPGKELDDPATGRRVDRVESVTHLKSYLTTRCGLAIIHGTVFKQPHFVRFSYANTAAYTAAAIDRFHESLLALES